MHFLKTLHLLSTYTTWVVTACSSGPGISFSTHNWWHLASALWLRQDRVTVLPEWGHTFGIPSHIPYHSHSHYAGRSWIEGANNPFSSFLYSLKWLRNRAFQTEFKITLFLVQLNQDCSWVLCGNRLPQTFPPRILASTHPIPGRPAGKLPLGCFLYRRKGELLCSEDKLLLKREGQAMCGQWPWTFCHIQWSCVSQSVIPQTSSVSNTSYNSLEMQICGLQSRPRNLYFNKPCLWFCCS